MVLVKTWSQGKVLISLAIGIAAGRFLLPILEGNFIHGIQIRQDKTYGCGMNVATQRELFGRIVSTTEGADSVDCGAAKEIVPGTWIVCDCSAPSKAR